MNEMIDLIFKADGLIKKKKSNYVPRESQIEAADILLQALHDRNHMILEGPCGFGKTFSYLIPLFIHLTRNKGIIEDRIVVATNGIPLSEQLIKQDLPVVTSVLKSILHTDIKFALMKGKGNFICRKKLAETNRGANGHVEKEVINAVNNLDEDFFLLGDLTNLKIKLSQTDLPKFACIQEGECVGKSCEFYQSCYYQSQKKTANEADIVITNYHMLFSNQKAQGMILPPYSILVLDEAHEVPNIARDFYCDDFASNSILWHRNKVMKSTLQIPAEGNYLKVKEGTGKVPQSADYVLYEMLTRLAGELEAMSNAVAPSFGRFDTCIMIKTDTQIPGGIQMRLVIDEITNEVRSCLNRYDDAYDDFSEADDNIVKFYNSLVSLDAKIYELKMLIDGAKSAELQKKYAYYYEKPKEGSIRLCKKMIMVNEFLYKNFFAKSMITTCLLTSATLSINGGFEFIKTETGLSLLEQANVENDALEAALGDPDDELEAILGEPDFDSPDLNTDPPDRRKKIIEYIGQSPFDLQRQQLWFMSNKTVDGNKAKYEDSMEELVPELIESCRGGVLFLCTSYKNMNIIYDVAKKSDYVVMNDITVLKQGDYPNNTLVSMFEKDKNSILVASRSFFTGIDVPGDSLRCVAIDKFPFPSPGDPVMMKLEELDKSGCFHKYSIPMMITLLKQAVGRGVRGIDDKCVVAFLDRRIKSARYAGRIISSFPYEKTATKDAADIPAFLFGEDKSK